jgi:FkbM family methyltransferase
MIDRRTQVALLKFAKRQAGRLPDRWNRRVREAGKFAFNYRGARSYGLRSILFSRLGRHSRLLLAPFGKAELLVSAEDQELGRTVFIRGDYERMYMGAALGYLENEGHSCTGKTFIDIGANIGTSTVDALANFGFARAVCFEPDSRNFKLLRLNLVLNDLGDRAEAFHFALSSEDTFARLERSPTNFGDSRISNPAPSGEAPSGDGVVECRSLDSLVDDGTVSLDEVGLLWLDTQGHDGFVMAGATKAVKSGIPVVVEYWPDGLRKNRCLEPLEQAIRGGYGKVVDLRLLCHGLTAEATTEVAQLDRVRERYPHSDHTDLLLLP